MKPLKESRRVAERFKRIHILKAAVCIAAFFFLSGAIAQSYKSAVGSRASYGGLLTYKHQLNAQYFAEGIVAIRWGGVEFTALIEKSQKAFHNENTFWYIGGGMHLGFHGRDNTINPPEAKNTTTYINLGADLIGGIEYCFPDFPINVSIDYKPSFHFTGDRWFVGEGIGLSVRYVLK
ncbi:hypothetical protein G3O08_10170 [Cryomorpha ignava]|uniref:Uncharacterized protein n=1 Tax=Cryomorpha ignava TaxID=101383 RepID=A0A7K3WT75_9FLAO|nr:hypothetical protein [Cryomorpha ignava]NEN23865.1 hypothetical protein [Cryomorpha ignava]